MYRYPHAAVDCVRLQALAIERLEAKDALLLRVAPLVLYESMYNICICMYVHINLHPYIHTHTNTFSRSLAVSLSRARSLSPSPSPSLIYMHACMHLAPRSPWA